MNQLVLPYEIRKKFVKNKSDETIRTYLTMAGKYFKEVFDTNAFSIEALKKTNKLEAYLKRKDISITSKKLITIALVMILKAANAKQSLIDTYGKYARKYRIQDSNMRKDRYATGYEITDYLEWDDIIQYRDTYENCLNDDKCLDEMTVPEFARFYMRYITLCLFTLIPPQRSQVYYDCYIGKDKAKSNFIDLNKKVLKIRNDKTSRSHGEREVPLPDTLVKILSKWLKFKGEGILLPNAKGEKMSTQSFTQYMKSIFMKDISVDMLRKIYITHRINIGMTSSASKKLAELMGHTTEVQASFYLKSDW